MAETFEANIENFLDTRYAEAKNVVIFPLYSSIIRRSNILCFPIFACPSHFLLVSPENTITFVIRPPFIPRSYASSANLERKTRAGLISLRCIDFHSEAGFLQMNWQKPEEV